jgi:hypothetical protein
MLLVERPQFVCNTPSVVKALRVDGRFNVIVAIPSEMFRVTALIAVRKGHGGIAVDTV